MLTINATDWCVEMSPRFRDSSNNICRDISFASTMARQILYPEAQSLALKDYCDVSQG